MTATAISTGVQGGNRIAFANSLRGIAALMVVATHQIGVFWFGGSTATDQAFLPALPRSEFAIPYFAYVVQFSSFISWGSLGVSLFFMISGFVIPFSFKKVSGTGFLIGRVFRIWPTYIAGLTITLLFLLLGSRYFGTHLDISTRQVLIHYVPGLRDLLWSRVLDGVVWTLEIEVKFYLACALMAGLFRRYSMGVFVAPLVLFSLAAWLLLNMPQAEAMGGYFYTLPLIFSKSFQFMIYMFIGSAWHYFYMKKISFAKLIFLSAAFLAMFYALWMKGESAPHRGDLAYLYSIILFGLAMKAPIWLVKNRVLTFFADISYPLYLCHAFTGYVALRILLDRGWRPSIAHVVVLAGCITLAWLVHVLVEVPSHALGKRAMKLARPVPAVPAVATAVDGSAPILAAATSAASLAPA